MIPVPRHDNLLTMRDTHKEITLQEDLLTMITTKKT